jgi:hypothetical protein
VERAELKLEKVEKVLETNIEMTYLVLEEIDVIYKKYKIKASTYGHPLFSI